MIQKHHHSVAVFETLKCKKHIFVSAAQIFIKIVSVASVSVTSESSHSLYERDQLMRIINTDEWIQKKQEFILKLIFSVMKVQTDCFISEMIVIIIEHSDFQMIAIFFIFLMYLSVIIFSFIWLFVLFRISSVMI